jgi:hypothetical protein
MHAARRVQRSRTADGENSVTNFEISFPLHFQSFPVPRIGVLRAPMLPSNRRHAHTTKTPRAFRLPRLPTHRPTRHPLHHHGRPDFRLPRLRNRDDDPPDCVTKSPTIPATPSRKGTYLRTSNTLDSRSLRHNSPSPGPPPSRGRLRRPPHFAQAHQSAAPPAPP